LGRERKRRKGTVQVHVNHRSRIKQGRKAGGQSMVAGELLANMANIREEGGL